MKPFRNVDIYPLLCHLLDIEPSPNNGSLEDVKLMLRQEGGVTVVSTTVQGQWNGGRKKKKNYLKEMLNLIHTPNM